MACRLIRPAAARVKKKPCVSDETGERFPCEIWSQSPLHMFTLMKNKSELQKLLSRGADPDTIYNKMAPIHLACRYCTLDIVKIFVKAKCKLNLLAGEDHESPLFNACCSNKYDIVKYLIKHGAQINLGSTSAPPVFCSASEGHVDSLNLLVKHGADLDRPNASSLTAVAIAVINGQRDCVKVLVDAGCRLDIPDKDGRSPLFHAVDRHNVEIVKLLLADSNRFCVNHADLENVTPLFMACTRGDGTIVELLLQAGADVNIRCLGKTPLFIATEKGYQSVLKHLINYEANLETECEGQTALFQAVSRSKVDLNSVKMLLRGGCDVDRKCVWEINAFQAALVHGNDEAAQLLLEADANVLNTDWETSYSHLCTTKPALARWLQIFVEKPRSLKRLCRMCIRSSLAPAQGYERKIRSLPIPDTLQKFLMFNDL